MPPPSRLVTKLDPPKPKVDPNSHDNVLHPVDGNPAACPGPVCKQCFKDGWPSDSASVGCEHGMWIRELPERDDS